MCRNNDRYHPETDTWEPRAGPQEKFGAHSRGTGTGGGGGGSGHMKNTQDMWIFQCAGCRLYCHWDCVFGSESTDGDSDMELKDGEGAGNDSDGNEEDGEGEEYLCHLCHELEFPQGANMIIKPVCFGACIK